MAERLLEAHQRGLWQNVDAQMIDDLKAIATFTINTSSFELKKR